METRIEINGVWYIREDAINDSLDILDEEEMDLTWTEECIYENDDYCFVASRIKKDDSEEFYPDIDIKFTDKRYHGKTEFVEEYWDNNSSPGFSILTVQVLPEHCLCSQGRKQNKVRDHFLLDDLPGIA